MDGKEGNRAYAAEPEVDRFQQEVGGLKGETPAPASVAEAISRTEPEINHVHHSYIWLGSLRAIGTLVVMSAVASLGAIVEVLAGAASGDAGASASALVGTLSVAGIFLTIAVCVVVYQIVSYRHIYYSLGAEDFNFYQGVLNKKRVHIPYQRVQSVDERATFVQRVFGICTVSIDTAGGAANQAVVVPYLQRTQADYLRSELFRRKQQAFDEKQAAPSAAAFSGMPHTPVQGAMPSVGASGNILDAPAEVWDEIPTVFGGAGYAEGVVTYEHGLSNKELVLAGVSNSSSFVIVVLGVLAAIVEGASQLAPLFLGDSIDVVGAVASSSARLFGGSVAALGIVTLLVVAFAAWAVSVVGTCLSYGGFRARRRENRIEVERGLLQHRLQGVDVDRVQSVIVKQGVIRRLLGYCELSLGRVDAAVSDGSGNQRPVQHGMVVHPFVEVSRVSEILAGLLPEFADAPLSLSSLPDVALRRGIVRRCFLQGAGFWLAVCVVLAQLGSSVVLRNPDALAAFGLSSAQAADALSMMTGAAFVCYGMCAAIFILEAIGAVLWARGSGFACSNDFMTVRNAGLAAETVSFPRRKIQYGTVRTNPFQRHAGVATILARTAAGVGGTTVRLQDADAACADAWLSWLEPHRDVERVIK